MLAEKLDNSFEMLSPLLSQRNNAISEEASVTLVGALAGHV
jgi:hypothetical protein